MSTIMELVEELVKAERDLAYAESAFDRIGKRDRQKEVDEARAALTAELAMAAAPALLEAVDTLLETAPCDCSDKRRYERGEHLSGCYLFDLNHARNGRKPSHVPARPIRTDPAGAYRCTACSWAGDTPSNCPKCAAEVTINDGVDVDRGGER